MAAPSDIRIYLEQKFVSLGCDALDRTRIYLDTNFWAMLRDHQSGRRVRDDAAKLLVCLREFVEKGVGFCTFSGHTLSELMKHKDASVRQLTAQLMDELGAGFCLANQERLIDNEIISFLSSILAPSMDRWSPSHLAWAKPFFILIDYEPPPLDLINEESLNLQKGFIDHVWSMPMTEVLEKIDAGPEPFPALDWPKEAVLSINSDIRKHDHENKTLHEFYLSELNGLLQLMKLRFVERYCEFVTRYEIGVCPVGKEQIDACCNLLIATAMHLASDKKMVNFMPCLHVSSLMHAMIRYDKARKFKANDLIDIEHAKTALPHCSLFFTDKPNAHLIRSTKLDTQLSCVVCDSPEQARGQIVALLRDK